MMKGQIEEQGGQFGAARDAYNQGVSVLYFSWTDFTSWIQVCVQSLEYFVINIEDIR